jgi:hypothetical protein
MTNNVIVDGKESAKTRFQVPPENNRSKAMGRNQTGAGPFRPPAI